MRRRLFILLALLAPACRPAPDISKLDPDNPFLSVTLKQFQLSAREALAKKDVSALANHVFLLKRELPVAWVAVADSSGTVLMHSDPRMIAAVAKDAASLESQAHAENEPLVRTMVSDDRRPVLDFTLPLYVGEGGKTHGGYARVAFYAGPTALPWAAGGPAPSPQKSR